MALTGIHPRIISWTNAFLSNHQYRVRVNNSLSEPRLTSYGVPEGGVLSPVLFNIYTFDLLSLLSVEFCLLTFLKSTGQRILLRRLAPFKKPLIRFISGLGNGVYRFLRISVVCYIWERGITAVRTLLVLQH